MQDREFKEVKVMTRQIGKMKVITSVMQAAEFIVDEWPGTDTEKLDIAKFALVKCYDCEMSPGVARMAFIEAAKEADIYVKAVGRPQSTEKLEKWGERKPHRQA